MDKIYSLIPNRLEFQIEIRQLAIYIGFLLAIPFTVKSLVSCMENFNFFHNSFGRYSNNGFELYQVYFDTIDNLSKFSPKWVKNDVSSLRLTDPIVSKNE
jgi:hypothetical protein